MLNETQIIEKTTITYINSHQPLPDEIACSYEVVEEINNETQSENKNRPDTNKLRYIKDIPDLAVAMLIAAREDVALIAPGDKSQTNREVNMTAEQRFQLPVGIYQYNGDNEGVWEVSNDPLGAFGILVEKYKPGATKKTKQEIFILVKRRLRIIRKCVNPYYVAVNNGIWDMESKILFPFSEDLVFTSKIHTNLNLAATNPVITIPEDGTTWDVDSWLNSLGQPTFVESIKEVIQGACLPLVPRNKMVLFYNTAGNNGKGTICQLIRNILGEEVVVSIPIAEFSKRFALADLPKAIAVITDENDVNSFGKGMGNLKAAITGDVLKVEQKYEKSYNYAFRGLVLQCLNDMVNGNDKSGSFKRRLHIIQFENCFTGAEKRYIKDRLIYREDVLEYILKMVLVDMDYREEFTETAETKKALELYVKTTNSVVAFLEEILPECKWDLLPATDFLYEAYKSFYKSTNPSGRVMGRNDFHDSVREFVATDAKVSQEWEWTDSTRSKGYIDYDKKEPLLDRYDLTAFMDNRFGGYANREFVYEPRLKATYSGLKRRSATGNLSSANNTN
jgi:putative DNA primase/helicase